jgi:bifunctional pyridoxal-dependent enzyme with beta-cystathionase and maltose regulon repressor activities
VDADRHGWDVARDWIFTTHGLVNGTGLCIDAFTAPGDGVVLMTPVYHAFAASSKPPGARWWNARWPGGRAATRWISTPGTRR